MKYYILIINLFVIGISFSQKEIESREAFKLTIVVDKENDYSMNVSESPYFVKEKILQIYPSEKLNIEVQIKSDSIYSMKVVKKITKPDNTIVIDFKQNATDRNNIVTMLTVKNPFDKKLLYNAFMYTPYSNEWQSTSIIPIRPRLMNFETWPHAIITLVLQDWRLE